MRKEKRNAGAAEADAAVPEQYKRGIVPLLQAKLVRTASGIAVVAVMSKPHRCPHIAMTGGVCIYCPGGPDSDFESSTQSYTGYEPTSAFPSLHSVLRPAAPMVTIPAPGAAPPRIPVHPLPRPDQAPSRRAPKEREEILGGVPSAFALRCLEERGAPLSRWCRGTGQDTARWNPSCLFMPPFSWPAIRKAA